MSVTYSTNWMGPVNMDWYRKRGLTRKESKVLEGDKVFYPEGYGPGDTWEYDEITVNYCAGRIDIRDSEKEGYDGWDEYSLSPMHVEDWNALSDFLWGLTTPTQLSYNELIAQFEAHYGKQIRWATDQWVECLNCWTINGHKPNCEKPMLEK